MSPGTDPGAGGGHVEGIERVLVVAAHPDDIEFGSAGTICGWTEAGVDVVYCIVTDGDAGGFDPSVSRTEMGGIRRSEQEAAAEMAGARDVVFLGYPDGRLMVTLELRRDLSRVIRQVRPQRVLLPSPERNWQRVFASHPDHMAAGEAAMSAVYPDSRNPFAHPELLEEKLEAWTVPEVWVTGMAEPDVYVDITATIDRKIKALLCHVSQHLDPEALDGRMRAWGQAVATAGGLPEGRYAEAFRRVQTG